MKLYFTRHGQSEANVLNIFSNRVNNKYPLTEKGIQQANELADVLKEISFAKIYSSPLLRAVQTSQILSKELGTDFEAVDALREFDTRVFEEKSKTEDNEWRLKEFHATMQNWLFKKEWDKRMEGGESFNDIKKRFIPFLDNVVAEYSSQDVNILFVAHGALYQCMFPLIMSNISFDQSLNNHLKNCEYIIAEPRDNKLYCTKWIDNG